MNVKFIIVLAVVVLILTSLSKSLYNDSNNYMDSKKYYYLYD